VEKGFHPTMVLAQRNRLSGTAMGGLSFHPTMVLAQLDCWQILLGNLYQFPSHYGSRSTLHCGRCKMLQ